MTTPTENDTTQNYQQMNLYSEPARIENTAFSTPTQLKLSSEIVKRQNTLTKHFKGSATIRAVVYVSNPKIIAKMFDEGVDHLQIIIGHKRVHDFRKALDVPTVETLMRLRSEGKLELFTSDKIHYHSKLYICEFEDKVKLINGSANLTRTGTGVSGTQWNHIWIAEIGRGYENHEFYKSESSLFDQYKANTEEFFGDFADIFDSASEHERVEIIQNFIDSGEIYGLSEDVDIRKVTRLISHEVMNPNLPADQTVVSIMPSAPMKSLRKLEDKLSSIALQVEDDGKVTIPRGAFLNHEQRHYPQVNLDLEREKLFFGLGGKLVSRTADEYGVDSVSDSLQDIEDYISSVLYANPENADLAQRSVMEALLYILCTPFHSHYMRLRRRTFGVTEERGPRILHIWGGTSNGKSKLLNYASMLMTGKELIKPLNGEDFSFKQVKNHLGWSSVFPMMWDDLTNDKWGKGKDTEKVIKNYWDKLWQYEDEFPQLVLTSNRMCPRGPLQTRIKEIHLSSTYPRNAETRKVLASHLSRENRFFEYFTKGYIEHLKNNPDDYSDDEAYIGRKVILDLYKMCGRDIPRWFPTTSLEDEYSPTSKNIIRALHQRICTPDWQYGELILRFDESMQHWEFKEYFEGIPNEFEVERRGSNIFIKRPGEFLPWLQRGQQYYGKKLPFVLRMRLGFPLLRR